MAGNVRRAQQEREHDTGARRYDIEGEVEFFKPEKGTMKLDIIPYEVTIDNHPEGVEKGDLWWRRILWVHFGIGPEERTLICPKTVGARCPICEHRAELRRDPDADPDEVASIKAKERELFNVIDLDDEDKGVQLWEFSYHLFGKKLEEELEEGDEENYAFPDLEGGKTLAVRFGKKKLGRNEFLETTRIDFEEREDYDEDILEEVFDLDNIINVMSYDQLLKEFTGAIDDGKEEQEQDDDKPPKRGKRGGKSSRRSKPKEDNGEECPHGHEFGVDTDNEEECGECEVWTECNDAKAKNEAEGASSDPDDDDKPPKRGKRGDKSSRRSSRRSSRK